MTSAERGTGISGVELANVSQHGLWLSIDGAEHFLAFDHFPWFRDATIRQLSLIERPSMDHLYWPELDVDLTIDSIQRPQEYPLVSRGRST
jgi:Protein of unknown function (DUF2442)